MRRMSCKSTLNYLCSVCKAAYLHLIQMSVCFCRRLLEQGQHSDVKFLVHGQIFTAHRCVLSARSEYFTDMFETKWKGKNLITLKHPLVDKKYIFWLINSVCCRLCY